MSDDDEFNGIFNDATVADFIRPTSARSEIARTNQGAEAFNQFVEEQLRAVRTAWIAAETYMQPLAIVANRDSQRIFIPDDDETLRQFVHRMRREAQAMGAIWTFVAKRTMVACLGAPTSLLKDFDVSDPTVWGEAEAAGLLRLGVLWYAERREGQQQQKRHGQMQDEGGTLGQLIEGASNQDVPLFNEILGD